MLKKNDRKFRVASGLAALLILAIGSGCTGFFVNPTLTGITVGPQTPSIQQGSTLQLTVTGTYDDGSTKSLTGTVIWSSSDPTIATVSNTGLVTGIAAGTATITAQSGTLSTTTSVTVTLANVTSIAIAPTNSSIPQGTTQQFMATATLAGGSTQDVTNSVTWNSSNSAAGSIDSATGLFTALSGLTANEPTTITATSGTVVGSTTFTVTD